MTLHADCADVISGSLSSLNVDDPQVSQVVTTAVQVGIAQLLKSWGLIPSKVIGHSSGEFAAACAVGALSLESCLRVAYHRGRLASSLNSGDKTPSGAMLVIGASRAQVNAMCKLQKDGKVSIACINSHSLVVASGDDTAIQALAAMARSRDFFAQKLRINVAYHSHHMYLIADEYLECLSGIQASSCTPNSYYSSLRGQTLDSKMLDSTYWVEHLIRPVQFSTALEEMCFDFLTEEKASSITLIEIGPHSSLRTAINDLVKWHGWGEKVTYLTSLLVGQDSSRQMLHLASNLFLQGQNIDIQAVNSFDYLPKRTTLNDLPPYPWERKFYWHESRLSRNYRLRRFPRNDLIGSLVIDYSELEPRWRNILRVKDLPWLLHHKVQGTTVYPLAGYISMALEALKQWKLMTLADLDSTSLSYELREVLSSRPLLIPNASDVEISVTLRSLADGTRSSTSAWAEFDVSSWTQDQGWTEHCKGHIRTIPTAAAFRGMSDASKTIHDVARHLEPACDTSVDCTQFYQDVSKIGIEYGARFQNLHEAKAIQGLCMGHVKNPSMIEDVISSHQTKLVIHPTLLDAFFHTLLISITAGAAIESNNLYIPNFVRSLYVLGDELQTSPEYLCLSTSRSHNAQSLLTTSLRVYGADDLPYLEMNDMMGTALPGNFASSQALQTDLCYRLKWRPVNELKNVSENIDMLQTFNKEVVGSEEVQVTDEETREDDPKHTKSEAVTLAFTSCASEDLIEDFMKLLTETKRTTTVKALADLVPERGYYVFFDHEEPILQVLDAQRLLLLQNLFAKALGILWVTSGSQIQGGDPYSSMSAGWARCLRCEMASVKLLTLDVGECTTNVRSTAIMIYTVLQKLLLKDTTSSTDTEYAVIDGSLTVPRLISDREKNEYIHGQTRDKVPILQPLKQCGRNLYLKPSRLGLLESAIFADSYITSDPLGEQGVEIEIHATGMNFKDVMISLNQVEYDDIGLECSGIVTKVGDEAQRAGDLRIGDRVCALAKQSYANFTRTTLDNVTKIPEHMDFAIAASMPVVFCTAFHALFEAGKLQSGESVLIHSAAGGVGQAAIMLAQRVRAEVFATVGSDEKRRLLTEVYGIPSDHIFNSRESTFDRDILGVTDSKGLDVVLGSVSSETRRLSMNVLSPLGRFIEIGKRDLELNAYLELNTFKKALSFTAVNLEVLSKARPKIIKAALNHISAAMGDPLQEIRAVTPITKLPASQIESAMRLMQGGKHMGKIVIEMMDDDLVFVS